MVDYSQLLNAITRADTEEDIRDIVNRLREKISILEKNNHVKEGIFTLKQQILLIEALGLLKHPDIKNLTTSKQAILFSALLNRGEKSVKDLLLNLNKKDPNPDFIVKKVDNIKAVEELLESLGMSKEDKKK